MSSRFLQSNLKKFWPWAQEFFISVKKYLRHAYYSTFLIGLLSLIWFAFRTGTKPSRAVYPCQQAAATSGYLWLATFVLPVFSAVRYGKFTSLVRNGVIITLIAAVVIVLAILGHDKIGGNSSLAFPGQAIELTLIERLAELEPASDIFVVSETSGNDNGVAQLIDLMGSNGAFFYKSDVEGKNKDPAGLIASDDTIIIKVNCQWDERGGTNTDVVEALIEAITQHPDGFAGEIIVADNGQGRGSLAYSRNNAEDITQSVQKVVDSFGGYRVSTYLWDQIRKRVNEYSEGSLEDGYVLDANINPRTDLIVSYPKFKTKFGTHISFKLGVWNPETQEYDSEHLKVINVPVLKSHSGYGVTACIKHYMGVVADNLTAKYGGRAHDSVGKGGMGTEMVETRFPTLNILDAIWVNARPSGGQNGLYENATRTNIVAASTDPAALDYWAAKNILIPAALSLGKTDVSRLDPDNPATGSFGRWLRLSMEEIVRAGYNSTLDEARMNVFVSQLKPTSTPMPTPTPTLTPAPADGGMNPEAWAGIGIGALLVIITLAAAGILIVRRRTGPDTAGPNKEPGELEGPSSDIS